MKWDYKTPGIPDKHIVKDNIPTTKEEIRVKTLSKQNIREDRINKDIAA